MRGDGGDYGSASAERGLSASVAVDEEAARSESAWQSTGWLGSRVFRTERGARGRTAADRDGERRTCDDEREHRGGSCEFRTARTSRDVPRSARGGAARSLTTTETSARFFLGRAFFECFLTFHVRLRLASPVVAFVRARGSPFVDPPRSVASLPAPGASSARRRRVSLERARRRAPAGRRGRRTRRPTRTRETRATRETPARRRKSRRAHSSSDAPRRLGEDFSCVRKSAKERRPRIGRRYRCDVRLPDTER